MKDLSKVMIYIMTKKKGLTEDLLKALEDENPQAVLLNRALEDVKDIEEYVYGVLVQRLKSEMPLDFLPGSPSEALRLVK